MSTKPWQKQNSKSAFLMAKWLFGKAENAKENVQPKPPEAAAPTSSVNSAAEEIPKPVPAESAEDRSLLEDPESADINPVELVECWYSGDEQEQEEADTGGAEEEERTCSYRVQGHRYKKLYAKKKAKGMDGEILRALSTIG